MEKVVHSVVVDASRTSYNNKTSFIFLVVVLVCCILMQGKYLRHGMQIILIWWIETSLQIYGMQ